MSDNAAKSGKKQIIFLSLLILVAILVVIGYVAKSRIVQNKIIMSGDRAPEFRLQAPDGRFFSLSDFRGKVVMVHFWATWCPPCVEEMPLLTKLYPELSGNDFVMLAVSVDEGRASAVRTFIQQNNVQVPVLLNPDRLLPIYMVHINSLKRILSIATVLWRTRRLARVTGWTLKMCKCLRALLQ